MNNYKEKILAQFEPDIAVKLLEFAETISKQDCEVFVFMSRKFCCLYDLLLTLGVPPIQTAIVSDKVLDLETKFFEGKTVRIVDDIIICGTTVWKAKDKLLNHFKAKEVKTSVFCVNEKYWVKECIEPDYKAIVLSDERALTFCASVVNALAIAPRPYAVEFPYFSGIEVKNKYWYRILSSKDWNVYDITSKFQEINDVSNLTFFPTDTVLNEFELNLGENVANLIDIAKVRVHTQKLDWGVKMSLLSIVIFKPLAKDSLIVIFNDFLEYLERKNLESIYLQKIKTEFSTPISQLKLLQYFVGLKLASKFKTGLQKTLDEKREIVLNIRDLDIELLFGKWHLPILKKIAKICFEETDSIFSTLEEIKPQEIALEMTELTDLMSSQIIKPEFTNYPRNPLSDFSNIFLSLYEKKELPSRKKVKESAVKYDWDAIRKIDRLETGITWKGILEYLKTIFNYSITSEVSNVLSLVLDYSIDKGICVPVTRHNLDTNIVFRAYRHGEDVKFAEQETELCGLAIEKAQEALGRGEMPQFFLEKLLTLFIRIGAAKNFLQVQYGTTGNEGIAKIGFYLHGAVVKLEKDIIYDADNSVWLSKHLLEKQVIKRNKREMYAFNKHFSSIQIKSSSKSEAKIFGHIIGKLYKGVRHGKSLIRLNDDDLLFLSTCFRPKEVSAALLVELKFYQENLIPLINSSYEYYSRNRLQKTVVYNRLYKNYGYKALHSLHKKSTGWYKKEVQKAIEKGTLILKKLGDYTSEEQWRSYWASLEIFKREDEELKFDSLIKEMSVIGHKLLFYVHLFEMLLTFKKGSALSENNEQFNHSIDKLLDFHDRVISLDRNFLGKDEISIAEKIKKRKEIGTEINENQTLFDISTEHFEEYFFIEEFNELNDEVSRIIPHVNSALAHFEESSDATTSYEFALYYDIVDSTATTRAKKGQKVGSYRNKVHYVKRAINEFIPYVEQEAAKDGEEVYFWNGDKYSTNDAKYVFFSSQKQGFGIRRARDFVFRLFKLSDNDISFRMIICPTNAFYSEVYRRFERVEVEGLQFWEHFSRVAKKFKELEDKYKDYGNLILVINDEFSTSISDRLGLKLKVHEETVETFIAGTVIKVNVELFTW